MRPSTWRARKTFGHAELAGGCRLHAFLHRGQHRLIAVSAQDVDQLGAVGREPIPAIGLGDLPCIGLIEAHARQHGPAGCFDPRSVAHAVGIRLDLRTRHRKQRNREPSAVAQLRQIAQLKEAQLRCRKDDTSTTTVAAIGAPQRVDVGSPDAMSRQCRLGDIAKPLGFGREAGEVKQRNRAEARHRRAEMLEFIRTRRAFDALDHRHRPIVAREPPDHAAQARPTR